MATCPLALGPRIRIWLAEYQGDEPGWTCHEGFGHCHRLSHCSHETRTSGTGGRLSVKLEHPFLLNPATFTINYALDLVGQTLESRLPFAGRSGSLRYTVAQTSTVLSGFVGRLGLPFHLHLLLAPSKKPLPIRRPLNYLDGWIFLHLTSFVHLLARLCRQRKCPLCVPASVSSTLPTHPRASVGEAPARSREAAGLGAGSSLRPAGLLSARAQPLGPSFVQEVGLMGRGNRSSKKR